MGKTIKRKKTNKNNGLDKSISIFWHYEDCGGGRNMNQKDILILVIKIFGIYLIVRALEMFQIIGMTIVNLSQIPETQRYGYLVGSLLPFLLLIIGAIVLLKWPHRLSDWIYNKEETKDHEQQKIIKEDALQQIVYSGIGILIISNAIPRITQTIIAFITEVQWSKAVSPNTWASVVGLVIQLCIGIFLFYHTKVLIKILKNNSTTVK